MVHGARLAKNGSSRHVVTDMPYGINKHLQHSLLFTPIKFCLGVSVMSAGAGAGAGFEAGSPLEYSIYNA